MGKKSFNPMDAHRKEQKKRDVKKQKAIRKQARDLSLKSQDIRRLYEEVVDLDARESELSENLFKERKRKLVDNLTKVSEFLEKEDPEEFKEYKNWALEHDRIRKQQKMESYEESPVTPPPFDFKCELPPGIHQLSDIPLPEGHPPGFKIGLPVLPPPNARGLTHAGGRPAQRNQQPRSDVKGGLGSESEGAKQPVNPVSANVVPSVSAAPQLRATKSVTHFVPQSVKSAVGTNTPSYTALIEGKKKRVEKGKDRVENIEDAYQEFMDSIDGIV